MWPEIGQNESFGGWSKLDGEKGRSAQGRARTSAAKLVRRRAGKREVFLSTECYRNKNNVTIHSGTCASEASLR